ncbi:MAG: hypothetical protein IH944_10275 [Armatimonadetes bacterium]|nr:hypothetical protein [Armatimonadota bacterium]
MTELQEPIFINGSHGEGGSALLRTAIAVSTLTSQPVRIHDVRGAMRKPGLTAEDLTTVYAFADCCDADLDGAEIQSSELKFRPGGESGALNGVYDVQSHEKGRIPGNALVVLASLLPVIARSTSYSRVTVHGETHGENTICFDAFQRLTLSAHRALGMYGFSELKAAGFGYAGRGEVTLEVEPSALNPVMWESRGSLVACTVDIATSGLRDGAGEEAELIVKKALTEDLTEAEFCHSALESQTKGACITIAAEFERGLGGGSASLKGQETIATVAARAVDRFRSWYRTDATVDAFLADQMLVAASQADGSTVFTTPNITRRLKTMAWVIKQFIPLQITIFGREGEAGKVSIER